jgi:hypothetical protein
MRLVVPRNRAESETRKPARQRGRMRSCNGKPVSRQTVYRALGMLAT